MTGVSSLNDNVLVTAHADRSVRFWDKRGGMKQGDDEMGTEFCS
jgi:hypothetical protein